MRRRAYAEDLLVSDASALFDVRKYSWLDEVTLVSVSFTTHRDGGTFVFAALDVAHDSVILNFALNFTADQTPMKSKIACTLTT